MINALEGKDKNISQPIGIAALNYICFYCEPHKPGTGFGSGLLELVTALSTDPGWLREHTRLLQRANEWETGDEPLTGYSPAAISMRPGPGRRAGPRRRLP